MLPQFGIILKQFPLLVFWNANAIVFNYELNFHIFSLIDKTDLFIFLEDQTFRVELLGIDPF